MRRTIIIAVLAAIALTVMAEEEYRGILKPDRRSGLKGQSEYVYPRHLINKWKGNPELNSRWRLVSRKEADNEKYDMLKRDTIAKYELLCQAYLEFSNRLEGLSERLGKPFKDNDERQLILDLMKYLPNEKDREKVFKDLEKGKISKKLKNILKTSIPNSRAYYEAAKKDAEDIRRDWKEFFISRGKDVPSMIYNTYVDTVSNPFFYDNVYKAYMKGNKSYGNYSDGYISDVGGLLGEARINVLARQYKGWEWYRAERNESDNYEQVSESYPHSITYRRFKSHPEYRIINGMAFDKDGNLLRVMSLDGNDDFGSWAIPTPDYNIWHQNFNQHADDRIGRQIAVSAYLANDYDIQSKGNKVNHYIKTQLGLESLTKAEQARSDRNAKTLANAIVGSVRDEMRYGRNTRKGRAAQNRHAAAAFGALVGGAGDHYSSEGAAWLKQIFDDYWKYFNDRFPYSFERIDDTTIKTVYVDENLDPAFEIIYSYVQTGPYAVKQNIKVNRVLGSKNTYRQDNTVAPQVSEYTTETGSSNGTRHNASHNTPSNSDAEIFVAVEQQAEFPGGQAALMKWLSNNIRYPESALQNDIQGRVVVKFVVETDGSIGNATVAKGVDKDLDREAIRVVKKMPKWQPAKNNGVAVRSYNTLTVPFKLQSQ